MTLLYCVAFYPVMLVYGISLVSALDNFLVEHLHFASVNKGLLTLICMVVLFGILSKGRDRVVGTMSVLALPFAIAIIAIAAVQIPAALGERHRCAERAAGNLCLHHL